MNKIDKRLHFLLCKVKEECKKVKCLSDYELKNKTLEFKERLNNGETTDDILPEAFAVCCEADYRVLGMFPYDVQILGGIALHLCYLCEMNTGEGKTLTATMPLYLNGLTGKSSILVTANEYLAIRDAEEMGQAVGNLQEYWDLIEASTGIIGGCNFVLLLSNVNWRRPWRSPMV